MKDLDLTLDYMENARFNYVYGAAVARMESSVFTEIELLCISMIYHKFVLQNGPRARYMSLMQLSKFLQLVLHITNQRINRRIVFFVSDDPDCTDPKFSHERHCTLNSFIKMFSVYFSDDMAVRTRFAFSIYDEESVGYLNREQVMRFVDEFFTGDDEDEIFEMRADMLELLFIKFDKDKDMLISYDEYCDVVRQQPELLEFLGVIFPSKVQMDVIGLCVNLLPKIG
ncbi:EF-hand calcium-binding domain-containing protein 1-like [Drosophila innubila]|uniref:EF-hand calcium-binding domain-containing protein 1-like n=1 Tax=Drosophila innubila TaxID=198719 RepID=UPI00148E8B50|nr:EF-hand calcium-binding domain-containing protein 1-like [Drosophila innubila]